MPRPPRREPAPGRGGRAQALGAPTPRRNAEPIVCDSPSGGQHQPLDPGGLDRGHELAGERPDERLGERGYSATGRRALTPPHKRRKEPDRAPPAARNGVRSTSVESTNRRRSTAAPASGAERRTPSDPSRRCQTRARAGPAAVRSATSRTPPPSAAGRVAPSGRVGEAVRARRGELELDHACSITRWSPTTTPERSIAPSGKLQRDLRTPARRHAPRPDPRGRASGRARRGRRRRRRSETA